MKDQTSNGGNEPVNEPVIEPVKPPKEGELQKFNTFNGNLTTCFI